MECLFITFLLLLVISINVVKSSEEIRNRCQFKYGSALICTDFQYTYLPYIEGFKGARTIAMKGNFSEFVIDPAYNFQYIHIHSANLQKFELEKYANFKELQELYVFNSEQVVEVDLNGAEKLTRSISLYITDNKMITYSCESLKSANLKQLYLQNNNLEHFDFSCVPNTMKTLSLFGNKISNLNLPLNNKSNLNTPSHVDYSIATDSYCSYMRNLTSLTSLDFNMNHLRDFRFECLPDSIDSLNLYGNYLTNVADLAQIPHSHAVSINIMHNQFDCTCALLRDYVQLLDSGYVTFIDYDPLNEYGPTITCFYGTFYDDYDYIALAHYPWTNNAAAIKLHDASSLACLTTGEKYSKGKDSNHYNDNKTENGNNNNDNYNNTENDNNNTDTITDSKNNDNGTDTGDNGNGNSGSINVIDVSLIIISHIIPFYVMLF